MSGYILQGKKADGSMVNIDLAAKYDALGEEISVKYATKSELADAGNFDENGSYPNLTAGTATEATHAASADTATNSTYAQTASTADTAGYATTAKGDEDGNDIKNTYATKSELDAVDENASRFIENGSYPDLVAGTSNFALQADQAAYASSTASAEFAEAAFHADSADSATKATQDGQGRNIANTYALKSEVGTKKYNHFITIKIEDSNTAHVFMLLYKTTQSSKFQTVDQLYDEFNSKGFTSENAIYPASGQYQGQMIIGCYVSTSITGPDITYKKINFLRQAGTFISINGSAVIFDNGIVTDIVMED